ncbi:UNVERIFIED_CONTAM: competence protein CoiA family protein [Halobacillus marinus]|uniref:competence protein CoiA n=1 Tax=unclassified Halobacillus TaxID=2636472 RepID=UPI0002A4F96D|nr:MULTISPECIES: competence protein CoiA family protein [unclassified Halobacillus]ELK45198.1 hypothetical protein D479_15752 [Halobacillus sp. BAB-2008]
MYALDSKGEILSLYQVSKSMIDSMRNDTYHCPVCKEPVLIRAGNKVTPHFAHRPDSECAAGSGGETEEHERGKWQLFHWLKQQGQEAAIEKRLSNGKRPDVLLTLPRRRIALEYQCSRIPQKDIIKRTKAYQSMGIFPLWILSSRHFCQKGPHRFILNDFLRTCMYHFPHGYQLFFLDISKQEIILVYPQGSLGMGMTIGSIKKVPLSHLSFPQLFSSPAPFPRNVFHDYLQQMWYVNRTVYRKEESSSERQYRQYLYLKGLHFSLIPSAAFLPVPGQVQLGGKAYLWQTKLLIEHFLPASYETIIELPEVEVPETINGYQPSLSMQYLEQLHALNIVRKTGKNKWVKNRQLTFHTHMEAGLKEDEQTLAQLGRL